MQTEISSNDDVIDSRDVIARIEELESERQPLADAIEELEADEPDDTPEESEPLAAAREALAEWDSSDEGAELKALRALAAQASEYADDWDYGVTLIRDSYFKAYAKELADDIGAIPKDAAWPCTCIDWEQAARELQMDYTAVEFNGVTYWVR